MIATQAARHGGNVGRYAREAGLSPDQVLDFSANINPLGPPAWLRPLISSRLSELAHYPDPDCQELLEALSERHRVPREELVVGNGSSEILTVLPRVLGARRALIPVPAYLEYARACRLAGLPIREVPLSPERGFELDLEDLEKELEPQDLVILGQPNNPTGRLLSPTALRALARRRPQVTFLVDEAFADFVEGLDRLLVDRPSNLFVLSSLTKFYAIPGLRLGFGAGERGLIERLRDALPPWSVNSLVQAVGLKALQDEAYARETLREVNQQRPALLEALQAIPGLHPYPGQANFLLVRLDRPWSAEELARRTLRQGVAIRPCANFAGLGSAWFRVAVRGAEDNERLCQALYQALEAPPPRPTRKRVPAVMLCGTSSNAGKSILTAALGRILLQDGYRVAPFKAQNMSLNSFVTREGGEMGRAQVVQAQACRRDPEVRMNPVLLKPNSETGSQVIVLGKPVGNMDVGSYFRYKSSLFATVCEAYDSLAREVDCLVLEGAGSPAEVNLKAHDIVNLRMARYAQAPVLLVGDIDRGGVYASFVGTMEVLNERERAQIAGFVVNRFRGQASLLDQAHRYVREHTGRPVLGVVPHLANLGLPEEDSVSFKARRTLEAPQGRLKLALLDFPHISNFTDFEALEQEPDVALTIVRTPADLEGADLVMLPGSKNVAGDLQWLERTGLAQALKGWPGEIVGVCGGLQMLGETLTDPLGLESDGTPRQGLGLLPLTTELAAEKTLTAVNAVHQESGLSLRGYEIHHGQTHGEGLAPAVIREDGVVLGYRSAHRPLWGTYLHGLFDDDSFRAWLLEGLRARRGWAPLEVPRPCYDLEPAFDRLAASVRESLDMGAVYRLLGLP